MNDTTSTDPTGPFLLTITEACQALRIGRTQLYELIRDGRLKTVRINRRRFVAPKDLHDLIEDLREGGENVRQTR